MKKIIAFIAALMLLLPLTNAQKIFTREANVSFHSDAPLEKIEAHNKKGTSVIDTESGRMEFAVLIKAFQFEKALMQEHFNENYMESSKYPKAVFKGAIADLKAINFSKDGTYDTTVKGTMTIHGVSKEIEATGKVKVVNGVISTESELEILPADYDIEIPAVVRDNIAKVITVTIKAQYQTLGSKK